MSYKKTKDTIDAIKAKIVDFGELTIEQKKKINYKFRLEWNFNSNSMEGNTLTIEETRSVMVGNLTVNDKPLKDVLEMQGHDKVISEILRIGKRELRLSEKRICKIHKAIMYEDDETKKDKIGRWKLEPNMIYNHKGERYDFVAPEDVPSKIHALLNKTNASIDLIHANKKNAPHPIDVAMEFHLEYLDIHPFYDGNGRTARILTNLILISLGYNPFWINEKDRKIYYNYISDIQGYGGNKELFFEYCAGLVERSEQLVLNAIQNIDIEEEDDLHKEISLLKRQLEGEKFTKSPKNIYNIFQFINKDIWEPLSIVISQFDDLFSKNETKYLVNNKNETYPVKSIFSMLSPVEKSTKPKEVQIFGHNLYEKDVSKIEWKHTKDGLKNLKNTNPYKINFSISFEAKNYSLKLFINYLEIWANNYAYNEFPDKESIEKMKKELGRKLIENIKSNI
ncbi:Fic family protein [Flavobacterium sp. HJJ]|uniref:Fic family protein n=1 Tax=Flavobacterium sp. HJJ TaxID=2783792 RepID=UPI00188CB06A|nr:Fic family protein [Flavobacterium sp. HJJ]MBF4472267.1 Fic family protein [Flavobacterium sp. HJJ]